MELPELRRQIGALVHQIETLQSQLTVLQQQESLQTHSELERAVNNLNNFFHLPSQVHAYTDTIISPPIWRIDGRTLKLGQPFNRWFARNSPQYRLARVPQEEWMTELIQALVDMGLTEDQRSLVLNSLQGIGTDVVSISDANAIHQLAMWILYENFSWS